MCTPRARIVLGNYPRFGSVQFVSIRVPQFRPKTTVIKEASRKVQKPEEEAAEEEKATSCKKKGGGRVVAHRGAAIIPWKVREITERRNYRNYIIYIAVESRD